MSTLTHLFRAAGSALALCSLHAVASGQIVRTRVALRGELAPQCGGATYSSLYHNSVRIDNTGQVYFEAFLTGQGVTNGTNTAAFVNAQNATTLVWREGGTVAGEVLGELGTMNSQRALCDGHLAITVSLNGQTSVITAWPSSVVARMSSQAPGFPPNVTLGYPARLVANASGQVMFDTTLSGGLYTGHPVVFSNHAGPVSPLLTEWDPAPGRPEFSIFSWAPPCFTGNGRPVISTHQTSSESNAMVIYWLLDGVLQPIVDLPNAGRSDVASFSVASSGLVAIIAETFPHEGKWLHTNRTGPLTIRSKPGQPVPGIPDAEYYSLFGPPSINDTGDIAFHAQIWLSSTNPLHTLCVDRPTGVVIYAKQYDPLPAAGPGIIISAFNSSSVRVNAQNQFAFLCTLSGPGVTTANNLALVTLREPGHYHLVARTGTAYDVYGDGSVFKQVQFLNFADAQTAQGPASGRACLNDAGTLVYHLQFTDTTSGLFTASVTPCNGDVNCDSALDGFDVEVQEKAVGGNMTDYCPANPDFNGDFALDGFDVEAVELVVGGGPCP